VQCLFSGFIFFQSNKTKLENWIAGFHPASWNPQLENQGAHIQATKPRPASKAPSQRLAIILFGQPTGG
jgi:hypothetical protein